VAEATTSIARAATRPISGPTPSIPTTNGARCVEHMAAAFALSPAEIAAAAAALIASVDTPSTKRARRPT